MCTPSLPPTHVPPPRLHWSTVRKRAARRRPSQRVRTSDIDESSERHDSEYMQKAKEGQGEAASEARSRLPSTTNAGSVHPVSPTTVRIMEQRAFTRRVIKQHAGDTSIVRSCTRTAQLAVNCIVEEPARDVTLKAQHVRLNTSYTTQRQGDVLDRSAIALALHQTACTRADADSLTHRSADVMCL